MRRAYRNLCSVLLAAAVAASSGSLTAGAESSTEGIQLEEGQRIASIRVLSITGNELTYYELEQETDSEEETAPESETDSEEEAAPESETDLAEEVNAKSDAGIKIAPETEADTEQAGAPEFNMPMGEAPDMEQMESFGGRASARSGNTGVNIREMTGMSAESVTVYLPVSVKVHTDTGDERTFSILEAGDELTVLIAETESGEEMITEIWMADPEVQG